MNCPLPGKVFDDSNVHCAHGRARFVVLNNRQGWPAGPVPLICNPLPFNQWTFVKKNEDDARTDKVWPVAM